MYITAKNNYIVCMDVNEYKATKKSYFYFGHNKNDYAYCTWDELVQKYPIELITYYNWQYFDNDYKCTYPHFVDRTKGEIEAFKAKMDIEFADVMEAFTLRRRTVMSVDNVCQWMKENGISELLIQKFKDDNIYKSEA